MHGLIGRVGSRSRLFFLLLVTIRTMQVLVGCQSVRYLVENGGSMKDVHFVAFCRLLNIPYDPLDRYIWDFLWLAVLFTSSWFGWKVRNRVSRQIYLPLNTLFESFSMREGLIIWWVIWNFKHFFTSTLITWGFFPKISSGFRGLREKLR